MADNQGVTGAGGASLVGPNPGGGSAPDGPESAPGEAGGRGQMLSSNLAGRLLMVSAERIRQLSKEGWIEKQGKDQFYLVDVVQGYIRFRNDAARRAVKTAGESRVRDARAREIEIRNSLREQKLMETDDAVAIVEELVGITRAELAGLPARVTRDLAFRRTIETAINDFLERLADTAAARARAVVKDRVDSPPVAADAAGHLGGAEPDLSADSGHSGTA